MSFQNTFKQCLHCGLFFNTATFMTGCPSCGRVWNIFRSQPQPYVHEYVSPFHKLLYWDDGTRLVRLVSAAQSDEHTAYDVDITWYPASQHQLKRRQHEDNLAYRMHAIGGIPTASSSPSKPAKQKRRTERPTQELHGSYYHEQVEQTLTGNESKEAAKQQTKTDEQDGKASTASLHAIADDAKSERKDRSSSPAFQLVPVHDAHAPSPQPHSSVSGAIDSNQRVRAIAQRPRPPLKLQSNPGYINTRVGNGWLFRQGQRRSAVSNIDATGDEVWAMGVSYKSEAMYCLVGNMHAQQRKLFIVRHHLRGQLSTSYKIENVDETVLGKYYAASEVHIELIPASCYMEHPEYLKRSTGIGSFGWNHNLLMDKFEDIIDVIVVEKHAVQMVWHYILRVSEGRMKMCGVYNYGKLRFDRNFNSSEHLVDPDMYRQHIDAETRGIEREFRRFAYYFSYLRGRHLFLVFDAFRLSLNLRKLTPKFQVWPGITNLFHPVTDQQAPFPLYEGENASVFVNKVDCFDAKVRYIPIFRQYVLDEASKLDQVKQMPLKIEFMLFDKMMQRITHHQIVPRSLVDVYILEQMEMLFEHPKVSYYYIPYEAWERLTPAKRKHFTKIKKVTYTQLRRCLQHTEFWPDFLYQQGIQDIIPMLHMYYKGERAENDRKTVSKLVSSHVQV